MAAHPWDIDGAARAGMATAWINRTSAPYPTNFTQPDDIVTALDQLADALRRASGPDEAEQQIRGDGDAVEDPAQGGVTEDFGGEACHDHAGDDHPSR